MSRPRDSPRSKCKKLGKKLSYPRAHSHFTKISLMKCSIKRINSYLTFSIRECMMKIVSMRSMRVNAVNPKLRCLINTIRLLIPTSLSSCPLISLVTRKKILQASSVASTVNRASLVAPQINRDLLNLRG